MLRLPATAAGETEWSQTLVFSSDGRAPAPGRLEAFAALGPLSDALLRLMDPYVDWPPTPDELEELEAWLRFGAAVWNAAVRARSTQELRRELAAVIEEWDILGEPDMVGLVEEIAARKLRYFAADYRIATGVRVVAERGRATVEAASLAYLR